MPSESRNQRHGHLPRLAAENYRGQASVHWSMAMQDRQRGWLVEAFYFPFREILTHTMFRYGLACPIYCCMPDHIHLLWIGICDQSDQRIAAKFFRGKVNPILEQFGARFQDQPFDHVLREEEKNRTAFESVAEYIARNPERASLTAVDAYQSYPYTGCLVPGYPDLIPWQEKYWDLFWRIYEKLRVEGLMRFHS